MGAQAFRFSVEGEELQVSFHVPVGDVNASHGHAGIKELDDVRYCAESGPITD